MLILKVSILERVLCCEKSEVYIGAGFEGGEEMECLGK